jgi:hypothetical protein
MEDKSFTDFQEQVWDNLPLKKYLATKERVFDAISVIVQEWPDEQFAQSFGDEQQQAKVVRDLMKSIKRHLHLAYGEKDFGVIWSIILQALLYEMVVMILEWWRKKKANRISILKWRQRWHKGEKE